LSRKAGDRGPIPNSKFQIPATSGKLQAVTTAHTSYPPHFTVYRQTNLCSSFFNQNKNGMKKKTTKKLALQRSTVANLETKQQVLLQGGNMVYGDGMGATGPGCLSNAETWCYPCPSYIMNCLPSQQISCPRIGSCGTCQGTAINCCMPPPPMTMGCPATYATCVV
jgi:hypothetical protein